MYEYLYMQSFESTRVRTVMLLLPPARIVTAFEVATSSSSVFQSQLSRCYSFSYILLLLVVYASIDIFSFVVGFRMMCTYRRLKLCGHFCNVSLASVVACKKYTNTIT